MTFGIAILRAVVGGLFIGHGLQKLKGWFGGYGIEGTGGWMESVGLYPGKHHATAGGLAETAGGAMLVAGARHPGRDGRAHQLDDGRDPQGPRPERRRGARTTATSCRW